ncbi:MAG: outer-membrane lipoprotein carrier protein LolA [Nitrospirae bacterium]|nr:outer-membrane lipoprotein carrier protein LolA [Nitrospirota bacterium]
MKETVLMCIVSIVLVSLAGAAQAGQPSGSIFQKIKSAYDSFKDVSGRFSQVSNIKELNKEMTYEGSFRVKPPTKMSWRYEGDDEQEVYINDEELTIYKKKHNQAMRSKIDEAAIAQTPLALLRGLKDIEKNYDSTEKNNIMRLTPKNTSQNVKYFDVYPSKDAGFPIKKIMFFDKNDNTIELTLQGVKINAGLSNELFQFNPPEGVTIIDN